MALLTMCAHVASVFPRQLVPGTVWHIHAGRLSCAQLNPNSTRRGLST